MMRNIQCLCCGKKVECNEGNGSVKIVMDVTGFEPVMMMSTEMRWMCPACAEKMVPHVRAIVEMLGAEAAGVYWNGLYHLLKRKIGGVECEAKSS
jgi:hypothetical protein